MITQKTKTIKGLCVFIVILTFILSGYAVYLFVSGFHNVDWGQNLKQLNIITGQQFVDINSAGEQWTAEEMYSQGLKQQRQAFILLGISTLLFGLFLSKLIKFE